MIIGPIDFETFVCGQLVFYMPAPTIAAYRVAKTDNPLRPGVFLDYYVGPTGKFAKQYLGVDLEDFIGKNLHHRVGPQEFGLHIHRTEVVKVPAGVSREIPIFPLRRRYWKLNYTLEGLEEVQATIDEETMPEFDFETAKPDVTDEEKKKVAELQTVEEPTEYKYLSLIHI